MSPVAAITIFLLLASFLTILLSNDILRYGLTAFVIIKTVMSPRPRTKSPIRWYPKASIAIETARIGVCGSSEFWYLVFSN